MSVDFVSLFTGLSERDIGLLLKNVVQKTINEELTNTEISSIDNKTPVLITNSKDVELINDISLQSAINVETPTPFYMVEEPDGNDLKIWLKFQNAGELRDWSYQKNKSYSTGSNTMPGLFSKYNENSMLKYELYSYFNGNTHYAHTLDDIPVRILPNITSGKITSFFMRLIPISLSKLIYAENNSLFTKVDDDQNRYGYSVTLDSRGNIHFYIKNDYRQYYLFIKDAYSNILTDPLYNNPSQSQFRFENFNKRNFLTNYEFLCSLIALELPFHDWFFKYNPTTHGMSVINTSENNFASIMADTSLVTTVPVISLPIQEGKYTHLGTVQTTLHDNSGNGNNATIANITTGGEWNDDNTLTNNGLTSGGLQINFDSISAINTMTEFTVSFWYKPTADELNPSSTKYMVNKGINTSNAFLIWRGGGANDIRFIVYNTSGSDFSQATFINPFPAADIWYFIVAKWKSGEKPKLSINNSAYVEGADIETMTMTNDVNNLQISVSTGAPKGSIALFKFYTTQISQETQDELYYQGYHNPLFPKSENIQPVPDETPEEIFVPFTNVYTLDKMASPTSADYRRINSLSGNNQFIELHSVADGTSASDPETLRYHVFDGVVTGGDAIPFTRIGSAPATIDSSDNSSGKVGSGQNEAFALQLFNTGSGIGQTINGKIITRAIFWMRRPTSSVTGTLYCRIWNSGDSLTPVATLGSMEATDVNQGSSGDDWVAYTFTDTSNTVAMASNYRIGIQYEGYGGDDVIDIQRRASSIDSSAYQTTYDDDWDEDGNNAFSVKCDLYTGGTGSATVNPWIEIGSGGVTTVSEYFGATAHNLLNQKPTKLVLRLKKTGTPTGTFNVNMMTTAGVPLTNGTFSGPNTANSLTTSFQDYEFTNLTNPNAITSGIQISVSYGGTGGKVCVMTNKGNTTASQPVNTGGTMNYHGSTSYLRKYEGGYTSDPGLDVSMRVFTGGDDFEAFLRFGTSVSRITTKIVNTSSLLNNRKITKVLARLKKFGSPTGILNCYIRDASDNIKVTYSSIDVSTLTTSYQDYEFINVVHNYFTNNGGSTSGDKISFEYGSASPSHYIEMNTNKDVFDGLNTITQTYGANYTDLAQRDLAGKTYTGGEPDLNSRTRVVQSIEHQNSRLKGKKITRVKAFIVRSNPSTTGTCYCNIRGTNDVLIKTLGTVTVSTLNGIFANPNEVTFEDPTNNYPMDVGDKISIEFNGGSSTNAVWVLVRTAVPNYDGSDSYIRKYDEVDYDDAEPTKDLCAVMDEGGFSFTPDPGLIPDPTPTNIKDLLYLAGNNAKSGFLEAFLMEFRIYTKDITLDMADYLYDNRYSISPVGPGSILMPYSLRAVSLTE